MNVMGSDRDLETRKMWAQTKKFQQKIKKENEAILHKRRQEQIAKKREVQKLFSAKCLSLKAKENLPQDELIKSLIGDVSILTFDQLQFAKQCLNNKGIIPPQSFKEKYQRIFETYNTIGGAIEEDSMLYKPPGQGGQTRNLRTEGDVSRESSLLQNQQAKQPAVPSPTKISD